MARPAFPSADQLVLSLAPDEAPPRRPVPAIEPGARLIRPEQAAVLLGIGRTKLYALMARGDLESVTIDRRRLVPVDAVEDLVDRLRAAASRG